MKEQKNNFWNRKCVELGGSRSRSAWRLIGSLRQNNRDTQRIDTIGLVRWKNYYEELLMENKDEYKVVSYEAM